jgi:hypothetical protein
MLTPQSWLTWSKPIASSLGKYYTVTKNEHRSVFVSAFHSELVINPWDACRVSISMTLKKKNLGQSEETHFGGSRPEENERYDEQGWLSRAHSALEV